MNDYKSYNFSLGDFFFEDIEGNELSHIIIEQLPTTGDLYLEYPFGIWNIESGMQVTKAEIPFLRYKPALTDHSNLNALNIDQSQTISIHFKVNDGEIDSIEDNKLELHFPITKKIDNEIQLSEELIKSFEAKITIDRKKIDLLNNYGEKILKETMIEIGAYLK